MDFIIDIDGNMNEVSNQTHIRCQNEDPSIVCIYDRILEQVLRFTNSEELVWCFVSLLLVNKEVNFLAALLIDPKDGVVEVFTKCLVTVILTNVCHRACPKSPQ